LEGDFFIASKRGMAIITNSGKKDKKTAHSKNKCIEYLPVVSVKG